MISLASAVLITATMLSPSGEQGFEAPVRLDPELWQAYQERFIDQGRVVDRYQNRISHSEGQGYAMLMAEAAGDRDSFDQLWGWTRTVLQRPDGLFSWRYEHCPHQDTRCITDKNNASDGDILIAWALLRAQRHWRDGNYEHPAQQITEAITAHLLVRHQGHLLILPGKEGFRDDERLTVNASYWIFPALEDFAHAFGQPLWDELIASGNWLLRHGRFGAHRLPADWLDLENGTLRPSAMFPPRYSYDAVRIPLHQAWSKAGISAGELAPYRDFWARSTPPPAWVDLIDNSRSRYGWHTGMAAVATLAQHRAAARGGLPELPHPDRKDGYFSWSLTLLSHIAAMESAQ